ncbi:cysteine hydrolase family protein [Vallitalea okinawensis]|uniref:cysteine hydrolase family protein n=1 Tax=Vallitalea okinawensis TaxID=2078660 RepID=UPI000CFE1E90|nr:cysteine hydrolase family protein [Vallitalea okinawensis]
MGNSALVIIDVQVGIFNIANYPIYNEKELLENIKKLIMEAREKEIPIIYVQHHHDEGGILQYGSEVWQVHQDIKPKEGDIIVHKNKPDSFQDTTLKDELEQRNISHLIMTGLQTEYCVDTTCRRAFSLGYDVSLVKDGHSTIDSTLKASQIIEHHNKVLGDWFADVKLTEEIKF